MESTRFRRRVDQDAEDLEEQSVGQVTVEDDLVDSDLDPHSVRDLELDPDSPE